MKLVVACAVLLLFCMSVAPDQASDLKKAMKDLTAVHLHVGNLEKRMREEAKKIAMIKGVNKRNIISMKSLNTRMNNTLKHIAVLSTKTKAHSKAMSRVGSRLNRTDKEIEKLKKIPNAEKLITKLNNKLNYSMVLVARFSAKTKNNTQTLTTVGSRLENTNNKMTRARTAAEDVTDRLASFEERVTKLKMETKERLENLNLQDVKVKVDEHSMQLAYLKAKSNKRLKVAFSATLQGNTDVSNKMFPSTLIYRNIITNVGNSYNPDSGIFTTPVRGVYLFSFTGHASANKPSHLLLFRNQVAKMSVKDISAYLGSLSEAGFVLLKLQAGDCVHVKMNSYAHIFYGTQTTFSGMRL